MEKVSSDQTKNILRDYWKHTRVYPLLAWATLISTVGIQVAQVISPLYLARFIDLIAEQNAGEALLPALYATLFLYGLFLFVAWTFRRIQTAAIMRLQTSIMANIESACFKYLIHHSYHFFISHFAGSLVRRVARYKRSYEIVTDAILLQLVPTALFTIGIVGVLSYRHPLLGAALGGWVLFLLVIQNFLIRRLNPLRVATAKEDSKVTGLLSDAIGNHSTITLFAGSRFETTLFSAAVEKLRQTMLRSWNADELLWAAQGFLMVIINVGLMWIALELWRKGIVSVGDFALIQAYLLNLFERLFNIGREIRHLYTAFADATEMSEILVTPHAITDSATAAPLQVTSGAISFEDVGFAFGTQRNVLSEFNLSIRGREKVALVGPSGGGKSTITKLLLRLYDVTEGAVRIDGQSIRDITQESLREAIAFVPQEPILFHRTLMENIRYGKRDATEEEIIDAAKRAHCHEFIEKLPHRYDTYVGERGVKLSGGERQRIAIARAILKNAPILVLDEATSSLDSESEAFIQDALEQFMKNKTVLVIAHRLSTIMKMDRIVVIERGAVVASGTHDELLSSSDLYKRLWSIQAGGFIPDTEEA